MWNDKSAGYPIPTWNPTGMNFYPQLQIWVQIFTRSLFINGWVIVLPDLNPIRSLARTRLLSLPTVLNKPTLLQIFAAWTSLPAARLCSRGKHFHVWFHFHLQWTAGVLLCFLGLGVVLARLCKLISKPNWYRMAPRCSKSTIWLLETHKWMIQMWGKLSPATRRIYAF
jgi:hypothetical protein